MAVQKQLLCIATVVCLLTVTSAEVFSAIVELEKVLQAEQVIAADLRWYISMEEQRLQVLREIADDYDRHSQEALVDATSHVSNPINAFLLVKRFTSDWDQVEALIRNNTSEAFLQSISDTLSYFPDEEDLNGAATALLRLQDTYALDTEMLARGEIQGVKQATTLSAGDCFELGRMAYNQGDYYHSILWMQQALDWLYYETNKTADTVLTLDYLAYSTYMQGNLRHAILFTDQLLSIDPEHVRAQNNKRYYEQMLEEQEGAQQMGDTGDLPQEQWNNPRPLDDYRAGEEFQVYERLCRDEETHDYPLKHKLTCQLRAYHPMYYLQPLREEVMYFDPFIAVYHNLLSESEIAKVKEIAGPRLNRATVQNPQTGNLETAFYRVSKSAWLADYDDPLIAQISAKVEAMSNLTLDTAEELQVLNYGIGGHYEPHYDFARRRERNTFEEWRGNRMATPIFYMSDVEAGGATVFPQIGVKLWPEKGALGYWLNLRKSGEGDYLTRHAGCPVLTGSKWVCNKWLHERGQEFARPCGLDPEE